MPPAKDKALKATGIDVKSRNSILVASPVMKTSLSDLLIYREKK